MKDLFIGIYDSELVNVAILDSDKGNELKYIRDHHEVDKLLSAIIIGDPCCIIKEDLRKDSPEIQEFDRIFICEDGGIDLYIKGKDY